MKSARIEFDEDAKENTTLFNLPFEGSKDEIDEINSGDGMSNYVKDLTDRSALGELRSKELEFFNQKE